MSLEQEIWACEERVKEVDGPQPDTSALVDELLDNDIIIVGPQGELGTKSQVIESHRAPQKVTFDKITVTEWKMKEISPTSAFVCCRSDFTLNGKTFGLRFTRLWQKKNGQWKIVAGSVTSIA